MLELKNVSSGYGKKQVLNNISLNVRKGEILTVIGPNGCGKSTLIKTAVGMLKPLSGDIYADGVSLASMDKKAVARLISCLHQSRAVPEMTVEQMVLHGRFPHLSYPRRYSSVDRDIAFLSMAKMGISGLSDEKLSALSGGIRQKAYIAMALCQNTGYILLDEPTASLDAANCYMLMSTLRGLCDEGKGVAAVIHDLPLAFGCSDRIAVMDKGELLCVGTPEGIYESDIIKKVFGVALKRTKTENGFEYYCSQL